jgi:hypothetical protein
VSGSGASRAIRSTSATRAPSWCGSARGRDSARHA